jgi:hypothetical protein
MPAFLIAVLQGRFAELSLAYQKTQRFGPRLLILLSDVDYPLIARLANRFKEPSSWGGMAGLFVLLGMQLDPGLVQSIATAGAGIAGIVAFFLPEKKA